MPLSGSSAGFSIKIGDVAETESRQISKIQVKAYTMKPQIADFQNNIKTKLGVSKVPFLVVQLPEYFPVEKVPIFNEIWANGPNNQQVAQKINKSNSNFYLLDYKNPTNQVPLYIKKFSQVFSQVNTTKKEIFAQVEFYDMGKRITQLKAEQKPLTPYSILFDSCLIRAYMDLSKQFWEMFTTLASKISLKFANSPMMAVLPLLQSATLDLRLDSVNELDYNVTVRFMGGADEDLYKLGMEKKGQMKVSISFEELGYLEILIDLEILAVAQFNE